jgi:hypothetical protein
VMHVASPNTLLFDDAQTEILDPAILGTQVWGSSSMSSTYFRPSSDIASSQNP